MGLQPAEFWRLTVREFHLKWQAFVRARDWQRSLVFELSLMTAQGMSKAQRTSVRRGINELRRYPLKKWLLPE